MKRLQFSLASLVLLVVIAALGVALFRAKGEVQELKALVAATEKEVGRWKADKAAIDLESRLRQVANDKQYADMARRASEIARKEQATRTQFNEELSKVTDRLIAGLKGESPAVRIWAADSLRLIGEDAKLAVPALLEAKNDSDQKVREAAERALKVIDRDETEPVVK